jgi:hypothetical protein
MAGEFVAKGIDQDFPFLDPKINFAPGEKEQFNAIRADLDTPLQIMHMELI